MGQRIKSIRKWASAALGAALLTTSFITGAGAVNALPDELPYLVSVVPGTVGGSGKIVIVGAIGYTSTYANPNCASDSYEPRQMVTSTSLVTIGGTTYTSPLMSTWATATTHRSKTTKLTTPCSTSSGQRLSAPSWTDTYHMRTWSVDYTCQPAGTKLSVVYMYGLAQWVVPPKTIPDNGPLPASCGAGTGGGSDHCGCGNSGTGGTQHGLPGTAPSGSAAHGGGPAIAPGVTTDVAPAPARAAGTGGSTIVPGTAPVAPAAPGRTAGRGLAVQTAVAADTTTAPDQSALAGWSALAGLFGLGFAAHAARRLRCSHRTD